MNGAPVKKLPASPSVSLPGIAVTDRGGEEVDVGFCYLRAGGGDQLRDPRLRRSAGNDREFSLGNRFHTGSPTVPHKGSYVLQQGAGRQSFFCLASFFHDIW